MAGHEGSARAIIYALLANSGIAIIKTIAAIITGSSSMMAEAVHSFADCGNQVLLLVGLNRSKLPATAKHQLGYGKASYFWSFLVALLLFTVGGLFSVYEGVHKLNGKEAMTSPLIALGVLGVGFILEAFSLYGAMKEVNKMRGRRTLIRWFRETRQSELLVVVAEDIAALLGLLFAFIFVLLTWLTGNPIFDAIGSIVIGILLIVIASAITLEIKSLIIGESADEEVQQTLTAFIQENSKFTVLNLISMQLGNDIMIAVKASNAKIQKVDKLVIEINKLEKTIKAEFPQVKYIFFEPDNSI